MAESSPLLGYEERLPASESRRVLSASDDAHACASRLRRPVTKDDRRVDEQRAWPGGGRHGAVDGDRPCSVMVPRSLVMLAAVWTNNASMSSSSCSVTSLIMAPLSRRHALLGRAA
jgi:hypothetical protein